MMQGDQGNYGEMYWSCAVRTWLGADGTAVVGGLRFGLPPVTSMKGVGRGLALAVAYVLHPLFLFV